MSIKKVETARCGACRFYTPVGRRGGDCAQFGVPVQSAWESCCLAESPFQSGTKIDSSDINIELSKVTPTKEIAVESLSLPTGRFASLEKSLAIEPPSEVL